MASLLVVDALNLIRRMYAAMPEHDNRELACMSRCINALADSCKRLKVSHCCVVFETKCLTWRHALWADYKRGRAPMPEALLQALPEFKKAFKKAGFFSFECEGWEADDVMASLACRGVESGVEITLMSTDKGFYQLLGPNIRVLNYFDRQLLDADDVMAKFSVKVSQLVDLWALTGDSTNNLPGVKSIGIKSATDLLSRYGDLDSILIATKDDTMSSRWKHALETEWRSAVLTRKLARLTRDVEAGVRLSQMTVTDDV